MGKTNSAPAKTEAPVAEKPKRKQLTPEERIAKAEADLAALRARAEKRANKERDEQWAKRDKAIVRRDQAQAVIDEVDAAFPQPADDSTDTES